MCSEQKSFYLDEKDTESDIQDDDDEAKENFENFNGTGRTVTLQMLMSANVLQPGKSLMTIEYLGQKFVGDLLPDGKIKSQETETIFLTPSAWAMHCKRIINPEKKSGCGWASVKYKGRKLDVYKHSWLRKCALQKESTPDDFETGAGPKLDSPELVQKRNVFPHNVIPNRNSMHDANMLVEAIPFSAIGKIQPFFLTIKSSALLLADFHSHITLKEVCGYLGGNWDINTHTLAITKAYPCRNIRFERTYASVVESEIKRAMSRDQTVPVGWYHSHPKFPAEPSLRDCDSQLDHQIRMRGLSELTYTPCVALIISPYSDENLGLESSIKSIWVMPPNESKQAIEYGRPMQMHYTVLHDKELPEDVRINIQSCVDYYSQFRNEIVQLDSFFRDNVTFIEKLKNSLYPKFPQAQKNKTLWNWICLVLKCKQEDHFVPPKTADPSSDENAEATLRSYNLKEEVVSSENFENNPNLHDDKSHIDKKACEVKVLSLQEQLCLPSGLNMNPTRMLSPLATPNPTGSSVPASTSIVPSTLCGIATGGIPALSQSNPFTASSVLLPCHTSIKSICSNISGTSPSNSPSTIPSNSVSPAKHDLPIRASPSPAKSDSSSYTSRPRNSPISPGKLGVYDISCRSPSVTPNKCEVPPTLVSQTSLSSANELMAASLVHLAGQLPPNFLQTEISALFHQHRKDYGNTSLNQLAAAAAKAGGSKQLPLGSENNSGNLIEPNIGAAAATYSNNYNISHVQDILPQALISKTKTERYAKSSSPLISSTNTSSNSYKTKLMKDLEELKNDPLKMSELMRSPEYAALLLQQAEALGATTLGALGFGNDFSYLGLTANSDSVNTILNNKVKLNNSSMTSALTTDYNNLVHTSKLLGYDSYLQQSKNSDLNIYLQQQIGGLSKKLQKPTQSHSDYTALLQTYSKLFDSTNQFSEKNDDSKQNELSTLLTGIGNVEESTSGHCGSNSKQNHKDVQTHIQHQNDMLNQLLQSEKQHSDLNALLYQQNKAAAELNALFSASNSVSPLPSSSVKSNSSTGAPPSLTDSATFYNAFIPEKVQDYSNFFQQHHGKYNIPDPLSKSTLAANNLFMSPSAIMKIQEESLSTIMMKPPKSTSSILPTFGHSSTKSGNIASGCKYNFTAVDLAVSSNASASADNSNSLSTKSHINTSSVGICRSYTEPVTTSIVSNSTKKRMEYSSIADLAAPPPTKIPKNDEGILNLSNE